MPDDCIDCLFERENKMPWSESCGTVNDWLEQLKQISEESDCIRWWKLVNNVTWDRTEYLKLAYEYIKVLSAIVSNIHYGTSKIHHSVSLNYLQKSSVDDRPR